MTTTRLVPLATLLLLLAACATTDGTGTAGLPNADGHIAGIALAANEGEVQQGNAAASRATNSDVRAFAQMMVTDHTNAIQAARDTAARNNITPLDNETTAALRSTSPQVISNLNTWTGADFDRGYIQYQIDLHQWLLTALDTQLIPNTRNAEMRSLLQTQRASVAAHLERARQIRGRL